MARHYEKDANVEVVHMNLSHNDLPPDLELEKLPGVLLYPSNLDPDADFEPIQYMGEGREVEDIVKFVERNRRSKFKRRAKEEL